MTLEELIRKPSALAPLAMSATAVGLVVVYVAIWGTARQTDEGLAAHLWQFLMAAQVPIAGYFTITWLGRAPKQAATVLALQVLAALAAAAPVFLLGF